MNERVVFKLIALGIAAAAGLLLSQPLPVRGEDTPPAKENPPPAFVTESIRGRVVWMAEALQRRFGIKSVTEARERILALETPDGRMHPIVEDIRGRAFRTDKRLLEMRDVELLVRRYEGSPMVQIIRIYEHQPDGKYQVDYWCDVCAIVMFEFGPCDCCQDINRLRKQKEK